ncbi:MAG: Calcium-binding EF-hand-containing protein [Verrucomicrobia bacterium]|nr:Calcium-binding EF-hand-containing protein [Verrucomicrobiota bacterium]
MNTSENYTPKSLPALIAACAFALLAVPAFANDMESAEAKFKAMDTDGDGKISRAEHAVGAKMMFAKMDANNDGIVTADEMNAMHAAKGDHMKSEKSAAEKIHMIDANGDGQITADEHAAGSEAMFAKMDTDGDGYLSLSEMTAGHKMMKKDK